MDDSSQIVFAMLFGAIGLGFFTYGRRQKLAVPFLVGIALFIFPYFVTNIYILIATGIALIVLPYFVKG